MFVWCRSLKIEVEWGYTAQQSLQLGPKLKEHEFSPIRQDTHLYSFSAFVVGLTIQFWEETGRQLFGYIGQQFWGKYGEARMLVGRLAELLEVPWIIKVVKKWNARGKLTITTLSLTPIDLSKALRNLRIHKPRSLLLETTKAIVKEESTIVEDSTIIEKGASSGTQLGKRRSFVKPWIDSMRLVIEIRETLVKWSLPSYIGNYQQSLCAMMLPSVVWRMRFPITILFIHEFVIFEGRLLIVFWK